VPELSNGMGAGHREKDARDGVGHRFRWPGLRGPPLFFLAVISAEGYELTLFCFIRFCRCQICLGDPPVFNCCDMLLCIRRGSFRYLVALQAASLHEPPFVLGARRVIRRQVTLTIRARSKGVYRLLRLDITTHLDEYSRMYHRPVL
jgi:hypothetical protein